MQEILNFLSDLISQLSNLDPISQVDFLLKTLIYPLTLLNTYLIFREKLRKPKLDFHIEYSAFCRRGNYLDFKIDLIIGSRNEDIYLREIFLFNRSRFNLINQFKELWFESLTYYPYDGPVYNGSTWNLSFQPPVKKISIEKAVKKRKCNHSGDISDQNIEVFKNFKEDLWSSLTVEDWEQEIIGLKIAKSSTLPLTLVGELVIAEYKSEETYTNSSRKIAKSGWYLCCDYGVGRVIRRLPLRTRKL